MTNTAPPPNLMLVHGNRPEDLRDLLIAWMKRYPLAPLEEDVILIQSNGIAQWLKLALAADPQGSGKGNEGGGCGIATALNFSMPSRFLWQVYRAVLGKHAVPAVSPFDKSRLIWRLMRLLPELLEKNPVYAPLQRFLQDDEDLRKRFQLAERLADLLDQYQVYRADWLKDWEDGKDILTDVKGNPHSIAEDNLWQADLWRSLLADVEQTQPDSEISQHTGRASVHAAFMEKARNWPEGNIPPGLPHRVIVFGVSSMPQQSLEVLEQLGRWAQVLICIPNPCQHYWADIIEGRQLLKFTASRHTRRDGQPTELKEEDLHQHAHPLLAAWGKQGRDFIGLLNEYDTDAARRGYESYFDEKRIDLFNEHGESGSPTLLQQLQNDILDLVPLQDAKGRTVDPGQDHSIRFHACHGPQREMEVLQDQLLAAFNEDDKLLPQDVIVMVPDIETYAPHIQAVFGRLERDDKRYLPFCVADQVQRHTNPTLKALEQLLALPQSRLSVSDILDLLDTPAIRKRFGIAETDLPTLHRWIQGVNIRWGLNELHRASLNLPSEISPDRPVGEHATQNTWLFGMRRMLLGYAVGDLEEAWESIEPYNEIGGLEASLIGPLANFLDQLDATWQSLSTPANVDTWCQRFKNVLSDFFTSSSQPDGFTLLQLEQALQQWREACREAALNEDLPLTVPGPYWLSQLDDRGLSQRFSGGTVTFATLMPMRAIPFRWVCLVGMNDGDYPRSRPPFDFDLMGGDYRPGDRSRREDDRYLFLEALLSAREHLHISWVGHSITDNSDRPPSVLVGQLRDHIKAIWSLTGHDDAATADKALLKKLTTEHRLQAFSPAYFPENPQSGDWFTYDSEWQPGQDDAAGTGDSPATADFLPPMEREEPLTLQELAKFIREPVQVFFRKRLQVYFEPLDHQTAEDVEPFSLNGLQRWKLQDELIQALREEVDRSVAKGHPAEAEHITARMKEQLDRITRRGELPSGGFCAVMRDELGEPMTEMFLSYQQLLKEWPNAQAEEETCSFQLDTEEGSLTVTDRLGDIRRNEAGERGQIVLESSNLVDDKGKYRPEIVVKHWTRHLAHHLSNVPITTVILSKKGMVKLEPLEPDIAKAFFTDQLRAWSQGMTRPLPFAIKTAIVRERQPDGDDARKAYEGDGFNTEGEAKQSEYLRRAYPDYAALTASGEFMILAEQMIRPLMNAIPANP